MRRHPLHFQQGPGNQRGAALYIALIVLLLLALIGIVGMQVAGMQEKMSANYRNVNRAFQNAEAQVRESECQIEAQVNRVVSASCPVTPSVERVCDNGFDATSWASARAMDDPVANNKILRTIGDCIVGGGSSATGTGPKSDDPNPVFQITSYATDDNANPSADAAVDTIFRP